MSRLPQPLVFTEKQVKIYPEESHTNEHIELVHEKKTYLFQNIHKGTLGATIKTIFSCKNFACFS